MPRALPGKDAVVALGGRRVEAHADNGPPGAAARGRHLARVGRVPPLPHLLLPGLHRMACSADLMWFCASVFLSVSARF